MDLVPDLFDGAEEQAEQSQSRFSIANFVLSLLIIGLISTAGVLAYYGLGPMLAKPYEPQTVSNAPDAAEVLGLQQPATASLSPNIDSATQQKLFERLHMLTEVPVNEAPQMLYVVSKERLDGDFFEKAQINDVVFIFQKSGQAYLYRPSQDAIVATGQANTVQ